MTNIDTSSFLNSGKDDQRLAKIVRMKAELAALEGSLSDYGGSSTGEIRELTPAMETDDPAQQQLAPSSPPTPIASVSPPTQHSMVASPTRVAPREPISAGRKRGIIERRVYIGEVPQLQPQEGEACGLRRSTRFKDNPTAI